MRNTRKSGQILRSKKRPHPTLRSGRGSRTNSNTSYQIQARVIEADSPSVVVYGGADMPLTGPIPEGGTPFVPIAEHFIRCRIRGFPRVIATSMCRLRCQCARRRLHPRDETETR